MTRIVTLTGAAAILALTATTSFAAPCNVGTTTSTKGPTTKDTSSNVEGGSTAKVTPGAKGESPGTVGALNNAGAAAMPDKGEKKAPEGQPVKPGDDNC
ncbi:hypothetical protein R1A27_32355 (plasmid) [Methylobacterium sp. NMS12]|uniref:hypothetical protein n=1 Tax=Methylobacterium sp. NMS12 TaxID=3079766 RepID=UPI003F8827D2